MRTFSICAIALFALMTTAHAQNPFDDNTKVIDTQHVPDPTRDGQADIKYNTKCCKVHALRAVTSDPFTTNDLTSAPIPVNLLTFST